MADVEGLCAWLRGQLGDRKAVVGISGGVDSSVVAALCARAVGPQRVVAVRLPCGKGADDQHYQTMLVDHLGVISRTVDLQEGALVLCNAMRISYDWEGHRLRVGNIKARLRMLALYDFAAAEHGLVVGTTNRAEYEIGYATKYGDHGVDLEPLQDYLKGEVRALGRLLGLPEPLVIRVPTAGLWGGQTDEGEIGVSYDEIDRILDAEAKGNAIACRAEDLKRVSTMQRAAAHKRQVPPHYERPTA
jgi:NAD+ synthase